MAIKINLEELNIKVEVNNGRGPQPDPEANRQLAIDYAGMPENGLTMSDLVGKYKTAPKNLYDRLERMGVPRHNKQVKKSAKRKPKEAKPFFSGIEKPVKD